MSYFWSLNIKMYAARFWELQKKYETQLYQKYFLLLLHFSSVIYIFYIVQLIFCLTYNLTNCATNLFIHAPYPSVHNIVSVHHIHSFMHFIHPPFRLSICVSYSLAYISCPFAYHLFFSHTVFVWLHIIIFVWLTSVVKITCIVYLSLSYKLSLSPVKCPYYQFF